MAAEKFDKIKHTLRKIEACMEVLIMTVIFYAVWRNMYMDGLFPNYGGRGKYVLMGIYFALVCILFFFDEGFQYGHHKLADVLISQVICICIVNVITYFQLSLIANKLVNFMPIVILTVIDFVTAAICIYIFTRLYHHYYVPRNMLMIYGNKNAITLKAKMESRSDKYRIADIVSADKEVDYIKEMIPRFDAVVINDISAETRNNILKFCYTIGKRTYITPKVSDVIIGGAENIHLFDAPLMLVRAGGLNSEQRFLKRAMDILLCGVALLVLWPFMLVIAIAIKIEDGGPVFYKQQRVTINEKKFDILKFRSMVVDAEKDGAVIPAEENDSRITKVGRVIRTIRMDELPQIFNILKGDMSIVGPRPERVEHVEKYTKEIPEFVFRSKVKGGLTGYAQVFGKYNTSAYDKLKLDMMYIEHYSLLLDLKIILMTASILFKRESVEGFDKVIVPEQLFQETGDENGD